MNKTVFDPVLGFIAFQCGQEVDCPCIDLQDPFFLYRWSTMAVFVLANKQVHKYKQEVDGRFVYYKRRLSSTTDFLSMMSG